MKLTHSIKNDGLFGVNLCVLNHTHNSQGFKRWNEQLRGPFDNYFSFQFSVFNPFWMDIFTKLSNSTHHCM